MLHGAKVTLRARLQSDVEVLTRELAHDVAIHSRAMSTPWRPLGLGEASPFGPHEPRSELAGFSVIDKASGELLGAALLWGIDAHNRSAHLGVTLFPRWCGMGFGTDVVAVLCDYAFTTLGLHRMQLETLEDNEAMIGAAKATGFVHEGTTRGSAWVSGRFHDDVVYGLLVEDWVQHHKST